MPGGRAAEGIGVSVAGSGTDAGGPDAGTAAPAGVLASTSERAKPQAPAPPPTSAPRAYSARGMVSAAAMDVGGALDSRLIGIGVEVAGWLGSVRWSAGTDAPGGGIGAEAARTGVAASVTGWLLGARTNIIGVIPGDGAATELGASASGRGVGGTDTPTGDAAASSTSALSGIIESRLFKLATTDMAGVCSTTTAAAPLAAAIGVCDESTSAPCSDGGIDTAEGGADSSPG
eukprot:scaffold16219_cov102-Isochrysis_galbana.AAC.12